MKQLKSITEVAGIEESVHLSDEDVAAINASVADADAGLGRPFAEAWQDITKPLEDEKKKRQSSTQG